MSQVWYVLFDNCRIFSRFDPFIMFDLSGTQRTREQASAKCRSHATQHSFVREEKFKSKSYWKCLRKRHSRRSRCRVDRRDQIVCSKGTKTCYRTMSISQNFVSWKDNHLNKQELIIEDASALIWCHRRWKLRQFRWAKRLDRSMFEILKSSSWSQIFSRSECSLIRRDDSLLRMLLINDERDLTAQKDVISIQISRVIRCT